MTWLSPERPRRSPIKLRQQFHQIIFGVLFILIVLLLPGGLVDI